MDRDSRHIEPRSRACSPRRSRSRVFALDLLRRDHLHRLDGRRDRRNGEPLELVYVPAPSWQPALIAFGLAAVLASIFTWWPYGVAGAIVALFALRGLDQGRPRRLRRLPRKQRVATAVLPRCRCARAKRDS